MAKRNADFRAKTKGLCIFMKSLNLMDLALDKKRKSETKSFSFVRRRKRKVSLLPHYA
jgi:hypothetical protein